MPLDPNKYLRLGQSNTSALDLEKYRTLGVEEPPIETPRLDPNKYNNLSADLNDEEGQSLLDRIYQRVFTPPESISKAYDTIRSNPILRSGMMNIFPQSNTDVGLDISESMSTPGDAALMAGTGGAGTLARLGRYTQKGAAALLAARGGERLLNSEGDIGEIGAGGLELAGGLFGLRTPHARGIPEPTVKPKVRANPDGTFSVLDNPRVSPQARFDNTGTRVDPIGRVMNALDRLRPARGVQEQMYTAEKAERAARARGIDINDAESFNRFKREFSGEYEKLTPEDFNITQDDLNSLFQRIGQLPDQFARLRAGNALNKMFGGNELLQNNEINLLSRIFGEDFGRSLRNRPPLVDARKKALQEIVNLPRAIMASWDFSAPLRQGLPLIGTKGWWKALPDMVKSWGSEDTYRGIMNSIEESPNYNFGQEAGLKLSDLTNLNNREELLMSTWAEKVPGIRASNRAYTTFLNKLRQDTFDSVIRDAERMYEAAKETSKLGWRTLNPNEIEALNPRANMSLANDIADFVNNATGRGSLKIGPANLERYAPIFNSTLFSPRLIASRVQMMNPKNYIATPPVVRRAYLKSLLSTAGAWMTFAGLGKLAGADVSLDPNSADFGKMKFGDTRLDPAGGFQQYLVLLSRMRPTSMGGGFTSSTTGRRSQFGSGFGAMTRADVLENFGTAKLNPPLRFAYDMLNASEYQPFDPADRTAQMFIPMMAQDIIEIAKENPDLLPFTVPLGSLGMGSQTYERGPRQGLIFGQGGAIEEIMGR